MTLYSRKSIRLKNYDYSEPGMYFVTICLECRGAACCALECAPQCDSANAAGTGFGHIENGRMVLNQFGQIVDSCWKLIPVHFPHVMLDEFVVMPDHLHGIITIATAQRIDMSPYMDTARHADGRAQHAAPLRTCVPGSVPTIIRSFKSVVTNRVNQLRNSPGTVLWQRKFHERVIRNENELLKMRIYIQENPKKWDLDPENTSGVVQSANICGPWNVVRDIEEAPYELR
jgi:putative transposase